jgi:ADP-L-glycero-D-manno-heptose 6-epimerase
MMIVVTGAAGFIGSNIIKALNARGEKNILAVDDLSQVEKFHHLVECDISEYIDKHDFIIALSDGEFNGELSAILHQGACSDTMNHDGQMMMENNYRYSLHLLNFCQNEEIPLIYASSAAVYGSGTTFKEDRLFEKPLNIYGYSKALFDQKVRQLIPLRRAPIVGLRYFNVYGPHEQHKGRMASVAYHQYHQFLQEGKVRLFGAYDGWNAGEQSRDFVFVDDVVRVNLHFLDHSENIGGIFNVGTGRAQSFNDIALTVVNTLSQQNLSLSDAVHQGLIEYIEFPDALKGKYQSYTQADITQLKASGYTQTFSDVTQGVKRYMDHLLSKEPTPLKN